MQLEMGYLLDQDHIIGAALLNTTQYCSEY